jgi:hypothetical protein
MLLLAPPTLQINLALKQGAHADIELTVIDALGDPITDPTGYSLRAQIRENPTDAVLFEWNTTPSAGMGTITLTYSPVTLTSTATLTVTGAQSALFTFRTAVWDCFLVNPAGKPTCLAEGSVVIDPAITY